MIKRRIVATLLVAATLSLPAPASADHIGEPVYNITYYSDSSYSVAVGYDSGDCRYFGPSYGHSGQTTQYASYQLIGYCDHGYWVDIH
ncbi:MAG TPA: hypothetical protein VE053_05105 [Allosphingosinicella sp.]|nr:hypothetical protein [Allosphingosinicella sp.]